MKERLSFLILVVSVVLLSCGVVRAEEKSYIIVHVLNPEDVEIASIEGMEPDWVKIYDGDNLIRSGVVDQQTFDRPIPVSPGSHTVKAEFNGMTEEQTFTIEPGEKRLVRFTFDRIDPNLDRVVYGINTSGRASVSRQFKVIEGEFDEVHDSDYDVDVFAVCASGRARATVEGGYEASTFFSVTGSPPITGPPERPGWSVLNLDAFASVSAAGPGWAGAYAWVNSALVDVGIPAYTSFRDWYIQSLIQGGYYLGIRGVSEPSDLPWDFVGTEGPGASEGYHLTRYSARRAYPQVRLMPPNLHPSASNGYPAHASYPWGPYSMHMTNSAKLTNLHMASVPYDVLGTGVKIVAYFPYISSLIGNVRIRRNGEFLPTVEVGTYLQDGDVVITGRDSTAEITFSDGLKLRLEPNSHFRVEWHDPCWELKTFLGRMWALIFKPACFRVRTPTAINASRGTEFAVQVAADGTSTTIVLDGVVEVSDLAETKTVSVGQYQTTTVEPNGVPSDPQSIDPNQINRWWEDIGPKLSADFDLVCVHKTPLHTTEFDASTQTVKPEWWLAVENEGEPNDPNWVIDSITFQAPYELFNLRPEPNTIADCNYTWTDITLGPNEVFEIDAEQETETADVNFPYTITRTFAGNYITGAGELTTTVTVIPEPNISGFEVEISLYAAQSEQAWEEGNFFGTLGHVSNSGDPNESEHWGSAYARHYEWEIWDGYTPGELLTFSCTVHVDLNADIDWALIEPEVRVGGSMLTNAYSENWANNTVQLPNGGTISIDSTELANDTDVFIPWIEVYMPQYVATSKFDPAADLNNNDTVNLHDIAHFASRWLSTCYE